MTEMIDRFINRCDIHFHGAVPPWSSPCSACKTDPVSLAPGSGADGYLGVEVYGDGQVVLETRLWECGFNRCHCCYVFA